MSESPDLTRAKLPLPVVASMIITVVVALLGIGGQAIFIVYSVTAFKTKSETERSFDVDAQKQARNQMDRLTEIVNDQSKTLAKMDATLDAQATLLGDVRSRMSLIESGKK